MLSIQTMVFIETLIIICTVKLIGDTAYNCMKRYSKGISFLCILLCIMGLWLTVLASSMEKERIPARWWILVLVAIYIVLIATVTIISGRIRDNRLGSDCIIEAFDRMDMGLCYFDESGYVIMCNEFMHNFSGKLFGSRVINGIDFMNALLERKQLSGNEDSFEVDADGRFFQIFIKNITINNMILKEIKCSDVSELHEKMVQLSTENQKLQQLNEHLVTYGSIADKVIREKEILNAKIRIHDRFGELLLTARRAIEQNLPEEEMDEIVSFLKNTVSYMGMETLEEANYYQELVKSSNSIGVNIELQGTLPDDLEKNKLFCIAIRECVTNTVKHAKGKNVFVNVEKITKNPASGGKYRLSVRNDGNKPDYDKELGTGMSSLLTKIEKAGGTMEVRWLPEFKLTIEL